MVGWIHRFIFSSSQNHAKMMVKGLKSYKLHKDKESGRTDNDRREMSAKFLKMENEWTSGKWLGPSTFPLAQDWMVGRHREASSAPAPGELWDWEAPVTSEGRSAGLEWNQENSKDFLPHLPPTEMKVTKGMNLKTLEGRTPSTKEAESDSPLWYKQAYWQRPSPSCLCSAPSLGYQVSTHLPPKWEAHCFLSEKNSPKRKENYRYWHPGGFPWNRQVTAHCSHSEAHLSAVIPDLKHWVCF